MAGIRVISGKAKGRKLLLVPGDSTRPIGDRVKEALFNILRFDIEDAHILDLFGGTGSVAIEALSRGAAKALIIDNSRRAIQTIQSNLQSTGLLEAATVLQMDAFRFVERSGEHRFDLIYVAPPQYHQLWQKAVEAIDSNNEILYPEGLVIVQIHPREYIELELSTLQLMDERKYGNTLLVFYQRVVEDVLEDVAAGQENS